MNTSTDVHAWLKMSLMELEDWYEECQTMLDAQEKRVEAEVDKVGVK
jgi:hypothetical protein